MSTCENKIFHKLPLLRERQDKCDMKSLVNACNNVLSISEGDHPTLDHPNPNLDHLNHHLAKTTSFVCSSHPCNSPYRVEGLREGRRGWQLGKLLREVQQHRHQQLQTLLSHNLADLMLHLILEVVDFAFELCDGSHNPLNVVSRQGARGRDGGRQERTQ